MLGIYAGIFLLLLATVLICAVCSCGSVRRGTSLRLLGKEGVPMEKGGGGGHALVRPCSWPVFLLAVVTSNSWSLAVTALPQGPAPSVPQYRPLAGAQHSGWHLFSSACVHLCRCQHGNSPFSALCQALSEN